MARERDEGKRQAILLAAKRLFAARGFHAASVSDLAREVDLPVGSIYTYFENKEALFRSVVEEGWEGFYGALAAAVTGAGSAVDRLSLVLYRFLPELFADVELITIIIGELDRGSGLEEKLERLSSLVSGLVAELAAAQGLSFDFPPRQAMAAIGIYFLGSMDAVRIAKRAGLEFGAQDILDFVRLSVENSFGVKLPEPAGRMPPG